MTGPLADFLAARPPRPNPPGYLSPEWCFRLGRRFLRPERPRLEEARALTAALHRQTLDAAAAWERALAAGLARADAARVFADEPMLRGQAFGPRAAARGEPPTVEAVVAIASDPEGVLRAEAAGAEWDARRPLAFRADALADARLDGAPGGFLWRVLPAASRLNEAPAFLRDVCVAADSTAPGSDREAGWRWRLAFVDGIAEEFPRVAAAIRLRDAHDVPSTQMEGPHQAALAACGFIEAAARWRAAARDGASVDLGRGGPRTPVADLPDPFAPLFDVLLCGYLPGGSYDGRMLVEAPAPDPGRMSKRFTRGPRWRR